MLRVTLIQTDLVWENKDANLAMLEKKIESAGKSHVVILPEMFNTGFTMQPGHFAEPMGGPTCQWMQEQARKHKIILVGSIATAVEDGFTNRLLWVQPDGTIHHYDKRHLFGFANETEHYKAGQKRLVVSVNGWRILCLVCYDLRFPVWSRQQLKAQQPEFDAILYVANWPERRNLAWKTLLQARAIENQAYVIGVNRVGEDGNEIYHSGDSAVIDPMGNMVYQVAHQEAVYTCELDYDFLKETRDKLPFLKDGDAFNIFA